MNTTKKLFIMCLVALLGVVSVMPSTFSWYSRNTSQEGSKARYKRDHLGVSNGTITMDTEQFKQDAQGNVLPDADKKKEIKDTVSYSVGANWTNYYRTTFKNTGSITAYAGFYLNNITNSSSVSIGNNYPVVSEKITGNPKRTRSAYRGTRIYFNPNSANNWTWASGNMYYLIYKEAGAQSYTAIQFNQNPVNTNKYYTDLPEDKNVAEFYIAKGSNPTNALTATEFSRTKVFTKAVPSTVYKLTGEPTNDNDRYAACTTEVDENAIGLTDYYSSITTTPGEEFYISLPKGYNSGSTVSYTNEEDADSTKYTIDNHTGKCKVNAGVSSLSGGIKTKLTGAWGDEKIIVTKINIPTEVDNIPVCQNIKIKPNEYVQIEWYITNKSSSETSTFNIYSTI